MFSVKELEILYLVHRQLSKQNKTINYAPKYLKIYKNINHFFYFSIYLNFLISVYRIR